MGEFRYKLNAVEELENKHLNDDEENIRKSAEFIASLGGEKKQVNILTHGEATGFQFVLQ